MRWMLVVSVVAGCGSSSGSSGASCEARAADLAAWATTVDHTYGGGVMASDKLVENRDASPVIEFDGVSVMVTHDAITIGARPASIAAEIAARIADARRLTRAGGEVIVVVDRDAPIALVATAFEGIVAAGARDVKLAVARPVKAPLPPPPRSSVTEELEASDPDPAERAINLAKVMRRVIATCPAIATAFTTPTPGVHSKAQHIIDALRPSLVECSCSIDLDAFRSTLWVLLGPGAHAPAGIVRVTIATADERDAAIVTGTTWADAAPALFAAAGAGKHVRIVSSR
jgi:hypothetical protein